METGMNTVSIAQSLHSALPHEFKCWSGRSYPGILLPLFAHLQVSIDHSYFGDLWALVPPTGHQTLPSCRSNSSAWGGGGGGVL